MVVNLILVDVKQSIFTYIYVHAMHVTYITQYICLCSYIVCLKIYYSFLSFIYLENKIWSNVRSWLSSSYYTKECTPCRDREITIPCDSQSHQSGVLGQL